MQTFLLHVVTPYALFFMCAFFLPPNFVHYLARSAKCRADRLSSRKKRSSSRCWTLRADCTSTWQETSSAQGKHRCTWSFGRLWKQTPSVVLRAQHFVVREASSIGDVFDLVCLLTLRHAVTCNRRAGRWAAFVHPGLHTLGISSTQRVESMNSAVKKVVTRTGDLVELDRAIVGKVNDGKIRTERCDGVLSCTCSPVCQEQPMASAGVAPYYVEGVCGGEAVAPGGTDHPF